MRQVDEMVRVKMREERFEGAGRPGGRGSMRRK